MTMHDKGITSLVQQQFGPAAEAYVSSATHAQGEDLQRLLELAAPSGGDRVLDVATGGGHTALAFAAHVEEVIALDLTVEMLHAARRHIQAQGVRNVTYVRGLAEAQPIRTASLDINVCRIAAHHFADVRSYVAEAARTLRPGGLFLLSDHIGPDDPELDAFQDRFERWRDPSHVRAYTFAEWRSFLDPAGFEVGLCEPVQRTLGSFQRWTERIGMPVAERDALEQWLLAAEPRFKENFQIAVENGKVLSLANNFGIVMARRV